MTPNFVPLNASEHQSLKVIASSAQVYAERMHLIPLHIAEVPQAIVDFPVLITRIQGQGGWSLSALTSFQAGQNWFLKDGEWLSSFQPSEMQTYPFAIQPGQDGNGVLLVDDSSPALSQDEGQAVFDEGGQPSLWLSQMQARLVEASRNTAVTRGFFDTLTQLELIQELSILVQYADGHTDRINGLNSINEDRLKSLSDKELGQLNARGFIGPIYALLFSLYQLNGLIRHNNARIGAEKINRISLEIAKPDAGIS